MFFFYYIILYITDLKMSLAIISYTMNQINSVCAMNEEIWMRYECTSKGHPQMPWLHFKLQMQN